jgi:hypothetical protein
MHNCNGHGFIYDGSVVENIHQSYGYDLIDCLRYICDTEIHQTVHNLNIVRHLYGGIWNLLLFLWNQSELISNPREWGTIYQTDGTD